MKRHVHRRSIERDVLFVSNESFAHTHTDTSIRISLNKVAHPLTAMVIFLTAQ